MNSYIFRGDIISQEPIEKIQKDKEPEILPVTSRQKARLELKRWVGLLMLDMVIVLTASLRFTHGCIEKSKQMLDFFIVFEPFFLLYGQKTKSAHLPRKMASNQKMQENKLASKFNFT